MENGFMVSLSRPDRLRIVILLLLCLSLFFLGLGSYALWDIDEGMHASTSRVMVQSGDWIAPQFNGKPFNDKPPLFNWLVALSFLLFGFTEFAARLPAALLGSGVVLTTYALGRRLVGTSGAFLGAIVTACSLMFVALSRTVVHDILLVFCTTLALLSFYRAYDEKLRRGVWLALMYAACGLGMLAKGPLGVVLPGGIALFFLLLRRDARFILRMMIPQGVLIVLLVALPWFLAMGMRDPDYLRYFLVEQNLGSFASGAPRHPEPFWWYVPVLLIGFFPWSYLLPLVLWRHLRRPREISPSRLFLLIWMIFVFVLFSAASSKIRPYILPLFPAAGLLMGDMFARLLESAEPRLRRGLLWSHGLLIALLAWFVPRKLLQATGKKIFDVQTDGPYLAILVMIFVSFVVVTSYFVIRRRYRALFVTNVLFVVILFAFAVLAVVPQLDPYRSCKATALWYDRARPPDEMLRFFPSLKDSALFYTGRLGEELYLPEDLEAFLRRPGAVAIVERKRLQRVAYLREHWRILYEDNGYLVVEAENPSRSR
jgi:4-amino-4-deoxy-L-arabinose transferase-like glycosyltransferase